MQPFRSVAFDSHQALGYSETLRNLSLLPDCPLKCQKIQNMT